MAHRFLLLFCFVLTGLLGPVNVFAAGETNVIMPTGTKIPVILKTAVSAKSAKPGDEIIVAVGEDLTIDGLVVMPAGAQIRGGGAAMEWTGSEGSQSVGLHAQ